MNLTLTATSAEELESFIQQQYQDDPEGVRQRRLEAARQYFDLEWPRLERTPLEKREFDEIGMLDTLPSSRPDATVISTGAYIHLVDNQLMAVQLPESLSSRGVILMPMRHAVVEHGPEIDKHLGQLIPDLQDKETALNAALWQNGVYLYVPDNVDVPVEVAIQVHATADLRALLSRNLILCGRNSHVVITERLTSAQSSARTLLADHTEIVVKDGGNVQYGAIQLFENHVEGFIHRAANLYRDAKIDWNIGEFGSGFLVSDHTAYLSEPGATTKSVTVFFGAHRQHQDYTARGYHRAPHTRSDIVARGVMKGRAKSVFTGLTHIDAGARGSDGRQKEQTLMLSDEARADAIPSLIINERDVFASHAASAGPIDKAALFYLTSRGLTEKEAERMIVHGFLAPVIDSIPIVALRDEVWEAVERKIHND